MRRLLEVPLPSSRSLHATLVGVAVGLLLAGHLWIGLTTDWVPCTLDCGETYENYIGARNLVRFGWRATGGLLDLAASPDPAAHPRLYIHNPSISLYAFGLLYALGVRDLHGMTPWLTLPFFAGLLYLYLAVWRLTGARLLAAMCLLIATSSYLLVHMWGFQGQRVWSWLFTWGVLYHLTKAGRAHRLAAAVLLALSMGVDYPFAVFMGVLVLVLAVGRLVPLSRWEAVGFVALALGVPFVLRQVQVAFMVGPGLWAHDFANTFARRVPLVGFFSSTLSETDLADFSRTHGLQIWPGGKGEFQPLTWLHILGRAYTAVLGPALLIVLALWVVALSQLGRVTGPIAAGLRLSVALAIALVSVFLVFGQYMISFYGIFLMPLLVHWLMLLLGLGATLAVAHWRTCWRRVPVGAFILAAFILWRVLAEANTVAVLPPRGYPGREALRAIPGASVATLWISSAPSAYTDQWAASWVTMDWLDGRHRTFDPVRDYRSFFERDGTNPRYRTPDFIFVPRLHAYGAVFRCLPFGEAVFSFADGCMDLEALSTMIGRRLPLARSGPDYRLYDLRPQAAATEP